MEVLYLFKFSSASVIRMLGKVAGNSKSLSNTHMVINDGAMNWFVEDKSPHPGWEGLDG